MSDARPRPIEERVLVLAPTARDAGLSVALLAEAGIVAEAFPDLRALCRELGAGAGAAILTEESLSRDGHAQLAEAMARQPAWSDFPILVLTRDGASSEVALRTLATLGNVTLLERPVRVPTLVSSVRSALRARGRQYQIRAQLEESRRVAETLRQADRQKDEFLAMLAHELRNPLAPIRNALDALRRADIPAARAAELREMMQRQVNHLVRLVDDLLDVSRILRGRIELRVEPVDLAGVLSRAVETARPLIDAQGHELTVSLAPASILLEGDPVRLTQVFANLLNNAAKYTPRGGHLWVEAGRDAAEAVVRIRDDGMGISAEMLPRVFDLFTQAQRSLDRSQGGLGLGLTLVKRLVYLHGGRVEALSAGLGKGSEFVVRLPLKTAERDPSRATPEDGVSRAPHQPSRVPRRVLVVDDNEDAADSLAMVLRMAGHEVLTAYDGRTALEVAPPFRPEALILDIGLPGLSGYELARSFRHLPATGSALLVALTGYGQEDDRRRSAEAGFDHHFVKPVDLDALRTLLGAAHFSAREASAR